MSRIRCTVIGAPLVEHYREQNHTAEEIQWSVLYVVRSAQDMKITTLKRIEAQLIERFGTARTGLNDQDEMWLLID